MLQFKLTQRVFGNVNTLVTSPERLSAPLAGKSLHGVEPSKPEVWVSLYRIFKFFYWALFKTNIRLSGLWMKAPRFMLAVLESFTKYPEYSAYVRARHLSCVETCSGRRRRWLCYPLIGWGWIFTEVVKLKRFTGPRQGSLLISSCCYANMQTDNHISCLKTDLLKSCGTFRVLVGVTGSVATLKLPLLVSQLLQLPGVSCFVFIHFYSETDFNYSFSRLSLLYAPSICPCACKQYCFSTWRGGQSWHKPQDGDVAAVTGRCLKKHHNAAV